MCRFTLRTFLAAIALFAVGLGMILAPYFKQRRAIDELWERDVCIATQSVGPDWLQRLDSRRIFVHPYHAQVLVQLVDDTTVRVLGKNMSFSEGRQQILELRDNLTRDFALDQVHLVFGSNGPSVTSAGHDSLMELIHEFDLFASPCGLGNFRRESLLDARIRKNLDDVAQERDQPSSAERGSP